jgi:hypothetical protein
MRLSKRRRKLQNDVGLYLSQFKNREHLLSEVRRSSIVATPTGDSDGLLCEIVRAKFHRRLCSLRLARDCVRELVLIYAPHELEVLGWSELPGAAVPKMLSDFEADFDDQKFQWCRELVRPPPPNPPRLFLPEITRLERRRKGLSRPSTGPPVPSSGN